MEIIVYSKEDCGICADAKDKLKRLKLPYEERSAERALTAHDGWRTDGTVDARAMMALIGDKIPMLVINGRPFEYTAAMREVKRLIKVEREAASGS